MNRLAGGFGPPGRYALSVSALGLALLLSACASLPWHTTGTRRSDPPPPGLASLHLAALREPTSPQPHLSLARLYLELGNLPLAEEEARAALTLAPVSAAAHAMLARVLAQSPAEGEEARERTRRLEEAWGEMERALELAPGGLEDELLAASLALDLGRLDEAQARLDILAQKEPLHKQVLFDRGRLAARQHRYPDAKALFAQAAKAGDATARTFEAWATFMGGDENGARALYAALPEKDLDSGDRLVLSILALRRDTLDDAEAWLRARYSQPREVGELVRDLELIGRVREKQLKAAALADLLDARLAREVEDFDRAETLLRTALTADKRIPEAPEALAELLLFFRRDARQALKVLSDAPAQTLSYRRYHLYIQAYRSLQDVIGAQEVLREFLEFVAQDVEQGRRAEARDGLKTMVLLLPVPSLWQFYVDLSVEEEDVVGLSESWEQLRDAIPRLEVQFNAITAEGLLRMGRREEARKLLQQALIKEPANYRALTVMGLLAEELGDANGAEEVYLRLTVIYPGNVQTWLALGSHYLRNHKPAQARAAFEEVLRREADQPVGLQGLVQACTALADHDEALTTARKLTELQPTDPSGWLELARAAEAARRYPEQEYALRQAVSRDQSNPTSWMALTRFLLATPDARLRKPEEAVVMARQAVDLSDATNAASLSLLADALYEVGKYAEALQAIEQAVHNRPEYDLYYRQRRKIRDAIETASLQGSLQGSPPSKAP